MKIFLTSLASPFLCTGLLLAQSSATTPMNSGTSAAQSNMSQSTSQMTGGQSWTGLLVAAECNAASGSTSSSHMQSGSADRIADETSSMRTTTPKHETNTTYEQSVNQADRNSTASTAASQTQTSNTQTSNSSTANETSDQTMSRRTNERNNPQTSRAQTSDNQTANDMSNETMSRRTSDRNGNQRSTTQMAQNMNTQDTGWQEAQRVAGNMPDSCRITENTTSYALRLPDGRVMRFDDASNTKIRQQLQSTDRVKGQMKIFRVVVKGTASGDTISLDSIQI